MKGYGIGCVVAALSVAGCASEPGGAKDAGPSGYEDPATADDGGAKPDGALPAVDPDGGASGGRDAGTSGSGELDASLGSPGLDGGAGEDASAPDMDGGAPDGGGASRTDGGGSSASDAGGADADTHEQFCSGEGPAIEIPDPVEGGSDGDVCTGSVARQVFKNALCTCEAARFAGYLRTRSFSSLLPLPADEASGAPVGVNGEFWSGSFTDVGGTLRVQGDTSFGGWVNVGGDLELEGGVVLPGYLTVGRDAWFESGILVTAGEVGRNLHTQPGNSAPPPWVPVRGERVVHEFELDEPCACDPEELLDVAGVVAWGKQHNDNDNPAVDLDPGALRNVVGAAKIELPCGRFYIDEISGVGSVTFVVNGRTALFVGGDVANIGKLDIELGPEGELDVFVAGDLTQIGFGSFGDVNRPAKVRIYVGGDGDITYLGHQPFGGNLYAPRSRLLSDGYVDVSGSLFVRALDAGAFLNVRYDREVLEQGNDEECQPPPPPPADAGTPPECTSACTESCGASQTCVDGECTSCNKDSDCCAPLICHENGRCGPLLL